MVTRTRQESVSTPRIGLAALALIIAACGGGESVSTTTVPADAAEPSEVATTTTTTDAAEEHEHEEESDHAEGENDHEEESDGTGTTVPAEVDAVIEVVMDEFTFEPASFEVHPNQTLLFIVTNEGAIEHEFRLSNAHRVEEHLESGHDDHEDSGEGGGHHDEDGDVFIVLAPGETGELMLTVPEDVALYTTVACLLPGHYEAGMVGDIQYADA